MLWRLDESHFPRSAVICVISLSQGGTHYGPSCHEVAALCGLPSGLPPPSGNAAGRTAPLLVHLTQSSGRSRHGGRLSSPSGATAFLQQGSRAVRDENYCSVAHPCAPGTQTYLEKSTGSIWKVLLASTAAQGV